MRNIPFRRLSMQKIGFTHALFKPGEESRKGYLIIPDMRAVERTRTAKRSVPHPCREAQRTLEAIELAILSPECGGATHQCALCGQSFRYPIGQCTVIDAFC